MKTHSALQRTLQAFFITGISIFVLVPALAEDLVQVTADNYVRAESDFQMKGYIENLNCFGTFTHSRKPYDADNQVTVRGNRDTLYSFGVFDLTIPLSITLPDPKGRYQSLMIVSQDHSISVVYGPQKVTLTKESVGTRYVFLTVRTFMDPNDKSDVKAAHRLQDAVHVEQADIGKFEVPNWKKERREDRLHPHREGRAGGRLLVCDALRRQGLDAGQQVQRLLLQQRHCKEKRRRKYYYPLRR